MEQQLIQALDREIGLFVAIIRELLSQGLVDKVCRDRDDVDKTFRDQITVGQVRCLCFIWSHERVTIGDLSRGLGISYPAATKTVSRLAEKGLVDRKHHDEDRRSTFVEITPLGREVVSRVKPEKIRRLETLLGRLTPAELDNLQTGIKAFISVAITDEELFWQICLHCGRDHADNCVLSTIREKCSKLQ